MASLDFRTRTDGSVEAVDAAVFFETTLPDLIASHGHLAVPGARELTPRPLAIEVGGETWTLALDGDVIGISRGEDGATAVVTLDDEGLTDLVHDVRTPMGFFTGGDLEMARGRLEDFLDWGVILRSLIDGSALHTTGAVTFAAADGGPLDLDAHVHPRRQLGGEGAFPGGSGLSAHWRRLHRRGDGDGVRGHGRGDAELLAR